MSRTSTHRSDRIGAEGSSRLSWPRMAVSLLAVVAMAILSAGAANAASVNDTAATHATASHATTAPKLIEKLKKLDDEIKAGKADAKKNPADLAGAASHAVAARKLKDDIIKEFFGEPKILGVPVSTYLLDLDCVDDNLLKAFLHSGGASVGSDIDEARKCEQHLRDEIAKANPDPGAAAKKALDALDQMEKDIQSGYNDYKAAKDEDKAKILLQLKDHIELAKFALVDATLTSALNTSLYGVAFGDLFRKLHYIDQYLVSAIYWAGRPHGAGLTAERMGDAERVKLELLRLVQNAYKEQKCQGARQQGDPAVFKTTIVCAVDFRFVTLTAPAGVTAVAGFGPGGWRVSKSGGALTFKSRNPVKRNTPMPFVGRWSSAVGPTDIVVKTAIGIDGRRPALVTSPAPNLQCTGQVNSGGPNGIGGFVACDHQWNWMLIVGPQGNTVMGGAGPSSWSTAKDANGIIFATAAFPSPPGSPASFGVQFQNSVSPSQIRIWASSDPNGAAAVLVQTG